MPKRNGAEKRKTKLERDNRSNQLNPNNDAYWKSRGYEDKPINKGVSDGETKKLHTRV